MNTSLSRGSSRKKSLFEVKRERAYECFERFLKENNSRSHQQKKLLKLQLQAAKSLMYSGIDFPNTLLGTPLITVQRYFAHIVVAFQFRDLPGMHEYWFTHARNDYLTKAMIKKIHL